MSLLRKTTSGPETKVEKESKGMQKAEPARALSVYEEMDRMFDRFFPQSWAPFRMGFPSWGDMMKPLEGVMPRVDVIDRDDEIVVKAELPGVKKEDIDVSMTDHTLTIKGSSRSEEKEEKGEYYRCEISRGEFARTIGLPENVDSAKTKASFKDGVLELVMPKLEKSQRRTITVE